MQIVYKRLEELEPYENNPRKNDEAVQYVAESIRLYGFKVPIVIDKDGVIVAGHTRYMASMELGLDTVPCIVADDLTDEQVREFRLVDNKTSEYASWDFTLLEQELEGLSFDGVDFGFPDFFDDINSLGNEIEEDDNENQAPTRCKSGDIWQLGEHRLICGDSTDPAVVFRLMDGGGGRIMLTRPSVRHRYC